MDCRYCILLWPLAICERPRRERVHELHSPDLGNIKGDSALLRHPGEF